MAQEFNSKIFHTIFLKNDICRYYKFKITILEFILPIRRCLFRAQSLYTLIRLYSIMIRKMEVYNTELEELERSLTWIVVKGAVLVISGLAGLVFLKLVKR